jgi:hypothetical protein
MLFAQIPVPGADQALRSAEAGGWTAVLLCGTFLISLASIIWLIRKMFSEKDALATRLTSVEDFQKTKIVELHVQTATACLKAVEAAEHSSRALIDLTSTLKAEGCPYPGMVAAHGAHP